MKEIQEVQESDQNHIKIIKMPHLFYLPKLTLDAREIEPFCVNVQWLWSIFFWNVQHWPKYTVNISHFSLMHLFKEVNARCIISLITETQFLPQHFILALKAFVILPTFLRLSVIFVNILFPVNVIYSFLLLKPEWQWMAICCWCIIKKLLTHPLYAHRYGGNHNSGTATQSSGLKLPKYYHKTIYSGLWAPTRLRGMHCRINCSVGDGSLRTSCMKAAMNAVLGFTDLSDKMFCISRNRRTVAHPLYNDHTRPFYVDFLATC